MKSNLCIFRRSKSAILFILEALYEKIPHFKVLKITIINFEKVKIANWPSQVYIVKSNITMWKIYDFSITQILREINFWDSRSAKSAILTHIEALNFDFYEFLHSLETEMYQIEQNSEPQKIRKNSSFRTSRFSNIDFHVKSE